MEHNVLTVNETSHQGCIANVSAYEAYFRAQSRVDLVKPTESVNPRIKRKGGNHGSFAHQRFDKMRADKAVCAGDEDFLAAIGHVEPPT
jgi:hypothetical protein